MEGNNIEIHKLKKQVLLIGTVLFALLVLFYVIVYIDTFSARTFIPGNDENLILDSGEVSWNIDRSEKTSSSLTISGWALIRDEEKIRPYECYFVLYDEKSEKYLKLPSKMIERKDVTEYFGDEGANYDNSGIFSRVMIKQLKNEYEDYRIFILYRNNNHNILVDTKKYIELS